MKIKFDHSDYEGVHGKRPHGTKAWSFDIVASNGRGGYSSEKFHYESKFGDAKREARMKAESIFPNYDVTILVMP